MKRLYNKKTLKMIHGAMIEGFTIAYFDDAILHYR